MVTKPGKKGRKIGRKKKKPAQQRYTNEHRWEKNKQRKIEREKKRQKKLHNREKAA